MATNLAHPREQVQEQIREALSEKQQQFESGPQEGIAYVLMEDVIAATTAELDPPSEATAEVVTPGVVYVTGVCPQCRRTAKLKIDLGTELRVDSAGSTLRLKGKSKEVTHNCNQQTLDEALDGQDSFDLEDIVGDIVEGEPEEDQGE